MNQSKAVLARARGAIAMVIVSAVSWAQSTPATKPLTIEAIYAPGGLTGRGPETIEWSPDGTKLSYVQREGDKGDLWYMDAVTGEKKILVTPDTMIVTYVKGDKSEITPGTKMFIAAAKKQSDGTFQTPRINYGKDGLGPPM